MVGSGGGGGGQKQKREHKNTKILINNNILFEQKINYIYVLIVYATIANKILRQIAIFL